MTAVTQTRCPGDDCQVKDKESDIIKCIFCSTSHHIVCVSVAKKDIKQIWTCTKCKHLSQKVTEITEMCNYMKDELTEMNKNQTKLLELVQVMNCQLDTEKKSREKAEKELKEIQRQLQTFSEKFQSGKTKPVTPAPAGEDSTSVPSETPKFSALIGTSLLRNVDPDKLENWEVFAKGGATIKDLHVAINALPEEKMYKEIVVVGGSIDLETKSTTDIVEDYQALMVSTSLRAETTTFCSVLPRADKNLADKMEKLNEELQKVCANEGIKFVNVDDTFYLKNGRLNSACLLRDGLHLSQYGVDNLLQGCEVLLKQDMESAFTEERYKHKSKSSYLFKGHNHPLSNFYPVKDFQFDGISFQTSEAAYVHAKAMHHNDQTTANQVRKSNTGIHAKRLGDRVKADRLWQYKKVDVMDNILRAKIKTCDAARKALEESTDQPIIEDTEHEFWGRGKNHTGQNMLGKLWMVYRKKLNSGNVFSQNPSSRNVVSQNPSSQNFFSHNPHSRNVFSHNPSSQNMSRQWATRQRQPKCYKCGEAGHLLELCRQPDNFTCWNCGRAGHKQRNCRSSMQRKNFY